MKPTTTGTWLMDSFLNKEPQDGDYELARIVDVIQHYAEDMEGPQDDKEAEATALQLELIAADE